MHIKREMLSKCINNRKYLELTCANMASYLKSVSEEDYVNFEKGEYLMSEENLERISRVLCIDLNDNFNIEDYIDTTGLSEEEINDLKGIVKGIVGDNNA